MFEDEREFVLIVALDMCRWSVEDAVSQLLESKEEILLRVERYEKEAEREREEEARAKEEAVSMSSASLLACLFISHV